MLDPLFYFVVLRVWIALERKKSAFGAADVALLQEVKCMIYGGGGGRMDYDGMKLHNV